MLVIIILGYESSVNHKMFYYSMPTLDKEVSVNLL